MKPSDLLQVIESLPGNFALLAATPGFPVVAMTRDLRNFSADPENALGRPVFELFPEAPDAPGSVATLQATFERVIRDRAPHRHEQRFDVLDPASGAFRELYWIATNSPILDDAGEVKYILHQSEDAATERRHGSMAILDAMTEGVFTLDRRWRFSYVNPEAHRILRQEPGTLIGAVIWEHFPGSDDSVFGEHYRRTMAERVTSRFTAFYPGLQGWYEVTCYPAPEGISVYFRDVTARELAQQDREQMARESAQQRRLYETALNNTPDFVYIFGTDHRAIYANEALLKVWGVEDVRGKTWMDLGYEQWHADMHDRELAQVISTKAPIRGEIPFTGTNGRRVYDYIFAPVLGADGEVVAVAGTTRDVTARQAAEQIIREHAERLADADRAKDEFLATLSHELRNPLAPLKNGVEILRRTTDGNSIHAEIHSMMERQVDHLVRLVDDLMEVSRITRGKISLQLQPADLGAIVSNALDAARPVLEAGRHTLHVDRPDAPVHLLADPVRLTQILANLLNNAAKYSPPGSDIRLEIRKRDDALTVSVSDTGMGMEPGEIQHLFEMFTRGDRVRTSHQGGLGIGLALSRRLAMLHGGSLGAHSEGPGQGSTFTLELPGPFVDPTERVPSAIPDALRLSLRVLVADDNHDAGSSLADALRLFGAQVHVVDDGAEALEQFESLAPDVAILDIGMPRVTGYDVAQALRGRNVRVPLIALTGWGQASDRDRAIAAGFDHHLVKPVAIPALVRLLASLERGERTTDTQTAESGGA